MPHTGAKPGRTRCPEGRICITLKGSLVCATLAGSYVTADHLAPPPCSPKPMVAARRDPGGGHKECYHPIPYSGDCCLAPTRHSARPHFTQHGYESTNLTLFLLVNNTCEGVLFFSLSSLSLRHTRFCSALLVFVFIVSRDTGDVSFSNPTESRDVTRESY